MRSTCGKGLGATVLPVVVGLVGGLAWGGCGGGMNSVFQYIGTPFTTTVGGTGTTGPTTTSTQTGGTLSTGTAAFTDPCLETQQSRKFVRISMRNQASDYIHYFLVLIAYVNGAEYPTGGVCSSDIALYTSFGYTSVPAGSQVEFGNYCITGPALYYMHRNGQFQTAGGALASAIGPAQGTTPTFDTFFTSAGATVPVPDQILFHNPGTTTEGQALKISVNNSSPCSVTEIVGGTSNCAQDAFYYVDDTDRISGSTALGAGSGRRVPSEIQGTGCQCQGLVQAYQVLAPSAQSALTSQCNQFFRGGRIEYAFVRDDTDPPYPQLVWRVTDSTGARAHDFDSRAGID